MFSPDTLPGLGTKTTYVHSQGTVGYDWRTSPGYSRRGGFYGVTLHDYTDRDKAFGFRQVDYEAVQHLPILRESWVISLHGLAQTTFTKRDQEIPFFMLPSVGGGSTLRGFSSWRFRDANSLLLQAEWRIMANNFFDTARVLRRRQGHRAQGRSRSERVEERLRLRTPLPRSIGHAAARRRGEESRRSLDHLRFVGRILRVVMATSSFASRTRSATLVIALVIALGAFAKSVSTNGLHFYPDDPIAREPESQDASQAKPYEIGSLYEMSYNLFVTAGYKPSGSRAKNLNTIDEVPDSSWFTNRIGTTPITVDEVERGPNRGAAPDPSRWVVTRGKTAGVHPGFTAKDANGETWFLEFDPPSFPEGETGAGEVATKIFWALGYNQVETYLTTFDPRRVEIDPNATIHRPSGKKTTFTHDDLNAVLEQSARDADGTYRVVAGRLIPGKILGNFLFAGTRPDDPNDLVPHEHRRELRALRVFGAWTNLTDLKAANTLDALTEENGRSVVTHYLQDVGSTFGMCNDLHEWDLSWEYFYQGDTTRRRFFSFGFALSPWQTVKYVEFPSIGKFEGDRFDPRKWRPQTPTTAYMELRDDDAFWAARRVAAFTDDLIRAAVHTGEFTDPAAEKYLGDVLIKRRDKIASIYLNAVNPIVEPRLDANGQLSFQNAAYAAGVASGAATLPRRRGLTSTTPQARRARCRPRKARRQQSRRRAGWRPPPAAS